MAVRRIEELIEEHQGLRATTYRVRWREGGRGSKEHHPTFGALEDARRFRNLILYVTGRQWPTDAQLIAHGFADLAQTPPPPTPDLSIAEMCDRYLTWLATDKDPRPGAKTLETYRGHLNKRIAPTRFGKMDAADATMFDAQDWQRDVVRDLGYRSYSVRLTRTGLLDPAYVWAASMRSAPDRDGVPLLNRASPMIDVEHLHFEEFDRAFLTTPAEYVTVLRLAREVNPRWADLLDVEAATGMRVSEARALDADAVLAFRGALRLNWHMVGSRREPDTKSGRRDVPVPEPLLKRLAGRSGVLLPAVRGGRWTSDAHLWLDLRKKMAGVGIPEHISHHSFRTGMAQWLASKKIDPVRIDLMLGHKLTGTAAKYRKKLTDIDMSILRDATSELLGLD